MLVLACMRTTVNQKSTRVDLFSSCIILLQGISIWRSLHLGNALLALLLHRFRSPQQAGVEKGGVLSVSTPSPKTSVSNMFQLKKASTKTNADLCAFEQTVFFFRCTLPDLPRTARFLMGWGGWNSVLLI